MSRKHFFSFLWVAVVTLLTCICPFSARSEARIQRGTLLQIQSLLPKQYTFIYVNDDKAWSKRLDDLTLQILSTASGKVFCGGVQEDLGQIHNAFFATEDAARRGLQICRGFFTEKPLKHRPHRKQFWVVITKEHDFKADGWTSSHNETFLFLHESEINDSQILRRLIHEMSVSFDSKENLGFFGKLDWPGIGLKETAQSCEALSYFRRTFIKNAFTSLRAFEVEEKIGTELELVFPDGFAALKEISCSEKMQFIKPAVLRANPALAGEGLVNSLLDIPICMGQIVTPLTISDDEAIKRLESLMFTFVNDQQRNVCDFMTEGWPYYPGLSFRGGPGPRITGGWDTLSIRKDPLAGSKDQVRDGRKIQEPSMGNDFSVKRPFQPNHSGSIEWKKNQESDFKMEAK